MKQIAALFVATNGCYFGLDGVDPWDEKRDARLYQGRDPVVAHPPCSRWCQLAGLVQARWGHCVGDDGGCFESALSSVRRFGGVLEHPAYTKAWSIHRLTKPSARGGWVKADDLGGWTCHVEQGHYGHRARKQTWIYTFNTTLPDLKWGISESRILPRPGRDLARERRTGAVQRMSKKERAATPIQFRDTLISMARSCR